MTAWPQIKALRATLIGASIITFILCQRHLGFAVIFEIIFLFPWVFASIWVVIKKPQKRSLQIAKVAIWLLSIGIVISTHYFIASQTKANGQEIVNKILSYYESTGFYPENIQSIGYNKDEIRSLIGMGGYYIEHGKPSFFYASTYAPFETEHYDFSKREWVHWGD